MVIGSDSAKLGPGIVLECNMFRDGSLVKKLLI